MNATSQRIRTANLESLGYLFPTLPSDTKLLLTKNYSEIIIFVKITNFTRNSLKKSLFPGDSESAKCLKNSEK